MKKLIKNKTALFFALFLFAFFAAVQSGSFDRFGDKWVNKELVNQNIQYLNLYHQQGIENSVKLSEIYTTLRLFQSAEVGVSFIIKYQVHIGETVAALTKLVEQGIAVSAGTSVITDILKITQELSNFLSPYLFKMTLLAAATFFLFFSISRHHHLTKISQIIKEIMIMLFLVSYLVVPYAIHFSAWLGQEVTAQFKQDSQIQMSEFHKTVAKPKKENELKRIAEDAIHELERAIIDVTHVLGVIRNFVIRHLAVVVIDGILMPLTIFFVLSWIIRNIILYIRRYIYNLEYT